MVDEVVTSAVVDEVVSSLVVDSSDDVTELDSEVVVVIVLEACEMTTGRLNEATPDAPPLPPEALARIAIVAP